MPSEFLFSLKQNAQEMYIWRILAWLQQKIPAKTKNNVIFVCKKIISTNSSGKDSQARKGLCKGLLKNSVKANEKVAKTVERLSMKVLRFQIRCPSSG